MTASSWYPHLRPTNTNACISEPHLSLSFLLATVKKHLLEPGRRWAAAPAHGVHAAGMANRLQRL